MGHRILVQGEECRSTQGIVFGLILALHCMVKLFHCVVIISHKEENTSTITFRVYARHHLLEDKLIGRLDIDMNEYSNGSGIFNINRFYNIVTMGL
jgi:hypothetical protein